MRITPHNFMRSPRHRSGCSGSTQMILDDPTGTAGYRGFLSGKRVVYFGRMGEIHMEEFPRPSAIEIDAMGWSGRYLCQGVWTDDPVQVVLDNDSPSSAAHPHRL